MAPSAEANFPATACILRTLHAAFLGTVPRVPLPTESGKSLRGERDPSSDTTTLGYMCTCTGRAKTEAVSRVVPGPAYTCQLIKPYTGVHTSCV